MSEDARISDYLVTPEFPSLERFESFFPLRPVNGRPQLLKYEKDIEDQGDDYEYDEY